MLGLMLMGCHSSQSTPPKRYRDLEPITLSATWMGTWVLKPVTVVRAPFEGTIKKVWIHWGQKVSAAQPLLSIDAPAFVQHTLQKQNDCWHASEKYQHSQKKITLSHALLNRGFMARRTYEEEQSDHEEKKQQYETAQHAWEEWQSLYFLTPVKHCQPRSLSEYPHALMVFAPHAGWIVPSKPEPIGAVDWQMQEDVKEKDPLFTLVGTESVSALALVPAQQQSLLQKNLSVTVISPRNLQWQGHLADFYPDPQHPERWKAPIIFETPIEDDRMAVHWQEPLKIQVRYTLRDQFWVPSAALETPEHFHQLKVCQRRPDTSLHCHWQRVNILEKQPHHTRIQTSVDLPCFIESPS